MVVEKWEKMRSLLSERLSLPKNWLDCVAKSDWEVHPFPRDPLIFLSRPGSSLGTYICVLHSGAPLPPRDWCNKTLSGGGAGRGLSPDNWEGVTAVSCTTL